MVLNLEFYKKILRGYNYKEKDLLTVITPKYSKEKMMGKCICFSRVSTKRQDLDQQTSAIIDEAKKLGYGDESIIMVEFKESGISLKEEERQGIEKIRELISKDPDIDCIVCWELSRIARRADIIYSMRDFFVEHHVRWISLTPYMELIDSTGKQTQMASLMLGIFTAFAESEMEIKKERAKRGIAHAKEVGTILGGDALKGYKTNRKTKHYEIDPVDSKFIQNVFSMYATGEWTYRKLAIELKDRGYFLHTDIHSIAGILCGWINDTRYIGSSNQYPAIITKELFDKCQQVKNSHIRMTRTSNVHKGLCKGLIYSKVNGHALIIQGIKYSTHGDYKPVVSVLRKLIDPLIGDFTQTMINKYYRNTDKIKKELESHNKMFIKKLAVITYNKLTTKEKIERLQESYIEGKITKQKSDQLLQKYQNDLKIFEEQELGLGEEFNKKKDFLNSLSPIDFSKLDFQDKKKYLLQVISKIEIYKEKPLCRTTEVTIHCKLDNKEHVYLLNSNTGEYKII